MQKPVQLVARHGNLFTRFEDIVDPDQRDWFQTDNGQNQNPILIYHYAAGDIDTIDANNPNMDHLRSALYDCRETGLIPHNTQAFTLPNGTTHNIDN